MGAAAPGDLLPARGPSSQPRPSQWRALSVPSLLRAPLPGALRAACPAGQTGGAAQGRKQLRTQALRALCSLLCPGPPEPAQRL